MIDNYPTRLTSEGSFIMRKDPVVYNKPKLLTLEQHRFYVVNGYLKIEKFFPIADINKCLEKSETVQGLLTRDHRLGIKRAITGIHTHDPFNSLSKNEDLLSITRSILGGSFYIHQSRINYKAGLGANGWHWHSDFETWHAQDGMPGMCCISAMIPLTENTNCNGSLMVIPGSHEYFYSCKKEETVSAEENYAEQKEGVPDTAALYKFFNYCENKIEMITCSPGDLVLFDCNTLHVSTQNMTPLPRTNLFFVYNSIENILQKPFSVDVSRPEEMGTRLITEIL